MKKILSMSGAASDIPALLGCALATLSKGFEPNVFCGVSSGAILTLPLALKKYNEAKQLCLNFTLDTIFDKKPVNEKGKPTFAAITRLLSGQKALGSMENLRTTLKSIITENDFKTLNCDVFVGVVNYNTKRSEIVNLRNCSYENAISYVVASASIPLFTKPITINGNDYFDGGIRDHSIGNKVIEFSDFDELVSIFIRDANKERRSTDTFTQIIGTTLGIMTNEISLSDQKIESEICELKDKKYTCFVVDGTMESFYDCDKERLQIAYDKGFSEGVKYK